MHCKQWLHRTSRAAVKAAPVEWATNLNIEFCFFEHKNYLRFANFEGEWKKIDLMREQGKFNLTSLKARREQNSMNRT